MYPKQITKINMPIHAIAIYFARLLLSCEE